jgi:hypothetical protein
MVDTAPIVAGYMNRPQPSGPNYAHSRSSAKGLCDESEYERKPDCVPRIRQRLERWTAAFNAKDVAASCDLFAQDLIYSIQDIVNGTYRTMCGNLAGHLPLEHLRLLLTDQPVVLHQAPDLVARELVGVEVAHRSHPIGGLRRSRTLWRSLLPWLPPNIPPIRPRGRSRRPRCRWPPWPGVRRQREGKPATVRGPWVVPSGNRMRDNSRFRRTLDRRVGTCFVSA